MRTPHNDLRMPNVVIDQSYHPETENSTESNGEKDVENKAKRKDKIPCREIRAKTNIKDVVKFAAKQKWKWAGHVARLNYNRWTKRITDWQPRYGKRSRGRQVKRWRDDIVQMKGMTLGRDAGQRDDWRRDAEGYILQWMDRASLIRRSVDDLFVFIISKYLDLEAKLINMLSTIFNRMTNHMSSVPLLYLVN